MELFEESEEENGKKSFRYNKISSLIIVITVINLSIRVKTFKRHYNKLGLNISKKVRADGKLVSEWTVEEPLAWYDNFDDNDFKLLNEKLTQKLQLADKLKKDFLMLYELEKLKNSYANTYYASRHYDSLADFHPSDYKLINFETILRMKLGFIVKNKDLPQDVINEAKYQLLLNKPYDESEPLLQHEMLLDKLMFNPAINNLILQDYEIIGTLLNKPLTKRHSNRFNEIGKKYDRHELAPHQKVTEVINHQGSPEDWYKNIEGILSRSMLQDWKLYDDDSYWNNTLQYISTIRNQENFYELQDNRTVLVNRIDRVIYSMSKIMDFWRQKRHLFPVPKKNQKVDYYINKNEKEVIDDDLIKLDNVDDSYDRQQFSENWFLNNLPKGMKVNEYNKIVDVEHTFLQNIKDYQQEIVKKFIPTLNKSSSIDDHYFQRNVSDLMPKRKAKRKKSHL